MRDAFGGAFFIKLMLIFFALYISFIAIALSYTKAFRVKNSIINFIEDNGGYTTEAINKIDEYINNNSYYIQTINSMGPNGSGVVYDILNDPTADHSVCSNRGYCVVLRNADDVRGEYYEVITFIEIQLPLTIPIFRNNSLASLGSILIPIKGETKLI